MPLAFLRRVDHWLGLLLIPSLAWVTHLIRALFPPHEGSHPRHVFLKMKGGGSLVIAMPALLGLRRHYPDAEFILVCTKDAQIYAELLGVFDRYLVVDETSLKTLLQTGLRALHHSLRATFCIDLEPNSLLAAVFTMATCSLRSFGLVKKEEAFRRVAYTDPLTFDPGAPIHPYYDGLCLKLSGTPASTSACQEEMERRLPASIHAKTSAHTIGIAAFTSDFARERMMPVPTWGTLLHQAFAKMPITFLIFGADRHKKAAHEMATHLTSLLPDAKIIDLSGTGDLATSAATLRSCDEIWSVDSGLLHIARALRLPNRSFWGPTRPSQRLRPIENLKETTSFLGMKCAPCVQRSEIPACRGLNLCMSSMADPHPNLEPPWTRLS